MKKILLPLMLAFVSSVYAQAFTENFDVLPDNWTYINNGSTNPDEQWGYWSGYFEMTPHNGSVLMAGIQFSDQAHNDYLISPKFLVTAGVSDHLSFYAQNYSASFQETLNVVVSETNNTDPAAFNATIVPDLAPSTGTWTQYNYDLSAFVGKEIYIAFHSDTTFQWFVAVDDFQISGSLATTDVVKNKISVFPNPFKEVLNISDINGVKEISVSDVAGRSIKSLPVQKEINLSDLKAGLYFVTLKLEDGSTQTIKAIKQ